MTESGDRYIYIERERGESVFSRVINAVYETHKAGCNSANIGPFV